MVWSFALDKTSRVLTEAKCNNRHPPLLLFVILLMVGS